MSKPKAAPPSAASIELERRQRTELDTLTREKNAQLKAIKQGRVGKRSLLSSSRISKPNQAGRDVTTGPPLKGLARRLATGKVSTLLGGGRLGAL